MFFLHYIIKPPIVNGFHISYKFMFVELFD